MSMADITTCCDCKPIAGYYDGDNDIFRCNRCDRAIKGSERFTMAELAEYNKAYKRKLKVTKDMQEIEAMFGGSYIEPSVSEINAKVERQRDSQIDNNR
jgi:hypothetical protein